MILDWLKKKKRKQVDPFYAALDNMQETSQILNDFATKLKLNAAQWNMEMEKQKESKKFKDMIMGSEK